MISEESKNERIMVEMSVLYEKVFSYVLTPSQYFTFFSMKALRNQKKKVIFVISVSD